MAAHGVGFAAAGYGTLVNLTSFAAAFHYAGRARAHHASHGSFKTSFKPGSASTHIG
jgi:hypothetical protein